jgi:hypothetical protein
VVLEECRYTRPDEVCVEFGLDLHAEAGAFVHSVRSTMEDSRADPRTARPTRMKKGTPPEDLYTVETQDLPDLVDVWLAFNRLYHDAWRAYVNLVTGVEAKDMPLPNSVSGSARLPATQHDQKPEARDPPRQDTTST